VVTVFGEAIKRYPRAAIEVPAADSLDGADTQFGPGTL
jgi:hypothetical protein